MDGANTREMRVRRGVSRVTRDSARCDVTRAKNSNESLMLSLYFKPIFSFILSLFNYLHIIITLTIY